MGELIKVVSEEEEGEEEVWMRGDTLGVVAGRAISRASIVTLPAPITNCLVTARTMEDPPRFTVCLNPVQSQDRKAPKILNSC